MARVPPKSTYCDSNLCSNVAKLCPHCKKEVELCAQRTRVLLANLDLLELHISVCDFRHRSQEE